MVQDLSAAFAELFAQRALLYLRQRAVLPQLVTRDSELDNMAAAKRGKTLTMFRSGAFVANDKTITGTYTVQDASLVEVNLVLDQHKEATTIVHEVEQVFVNQDLMDTFMPALIDPIVTAVEDGIAGLYASAADSVGSGATVASSTLFRQAKQELQTSNSPMNNLFAVLSPKGEFDALNDSKFIQADQSGDGGRALKEGFIGRKLGFDTFISNSVINTGAAPAVDHNLFFHKQAIGFGSRPLNIMPIPGAKRAFAADADSRLSINILTRWHEQGGMAVTAEMLYGYKLLNDQLLVDGQAQFAA